MMNIQPTKVELHVTKLLERIRCANELGRHEERRHWIGAYLNSFHAKRAAVQRANRRRKLHDRLDTATVLEVAAGLGLGGVRTNRCSRTVRLCPGLLGNFSAKRCLRSYTRPRLQLGSRSSRSAGNAAYSRADR
jgi:hypothetical protein